MLKRAPKRTLKKHTLKKIQNKCFRVHKRNSHMRAKMVVSKIKTANYKLVINDLK